MVPTSASAKAQTSFLRLALLVRASPEKGEAGCRRARRGRDPGADNRPSPLSLTPIRFALPITALREAAPSAWAMTFALLPSSASLFNTSIDSSVHSILRSPGSSTAPDGAIRPAPFRRQAIRGRRSLRSLPSMVKNSLISEACQESRAPQRHISNRLRRTPIRYACGWAANERNLHSEREEHLMARGGSEKTRSLRTAPYTSYRTFKTFIEDLGEHGVPSRIDRSVLTRFSGAVGGQLMHALRFLGLIDDEGRTMQRLRELVIALGGAEWPETLSQALKQAYAPMFAIDLETATPSHFSATFRKASPAADAVVQKCVTFFLYAAADAGLEVSARILKGRKPRSLAPRRTP